MAPKKEIVAKSIGVGGRKKLVIKPVSSSAAKRLIKKKKVAADAAAKHSGSKKPALDAFTAFDAFAAFAAAAADAAAYHNQESRYRCKETGGVRKKLPSNPTAANLARNKKEIAAAKLMRKKKETADYDTATAPLFSHNEGPPYRCEILVKSAHRIPFPMEVPREERSKDYRHLVRLKVEPTTALGTLKSILESYTWIPKENLVLIKEGARTPLNDDNCTLYGCGVKEHDTLLACTECGEYKVFIYHPKLWEFAVTVQSCFDTVGDVKGEIFKRIGLKPEAQVLTTYTDDAALEDWTPLVALGAVKPYLKEMENKLPCLKLLGPVRCPDELRGPLKRRYNLASLDTDL